MPRERFRPILSPEPPAGYPWDALDPARYPAALVRAARASWTENAFNEYCTFIAMGQLLAALGEAQAPLDLWRMASRFPEEEILHVELCARVADALGGVSARAFDPDAIALRLDPSLTPKQRAAEIVVRLCCVGEAYSLPMLAGAKKTAASPLTRAVLTTIVADEALHGRLGFLFLEWIAPDLGPAERDRLGRAASETLATYAPLWQRLTSRVENGMTSEGYRLEHVHELGWMESTAYRALALETIERAIRAPLARFGIRVTLP
jgi:hypothetical protein